MIETLSRDSLDPHYDGSPRAAAHRVVVHRPGAPRPVLTQALPVQRPSSPPPSERAPSPRPAPQGGLRLTRRGRLTVLMATIALLFAAFSAGHVMSNASSGPTTAPATHTVVVSPGDTFWSLARASMPHIDGRVAVDRLMAMNHSDGTLQIGQTLVVPGS
jgi:LysM domain